ncbi:amino acid ABC transporter permease [Variovorax sp. J22P240]|uniref:amino acid ABC transporter permease n=1 Tax=Variovorax sp. J22P240 TaxID=3053514 RepID=UPI00257915BB|nr:amino acid ABC transporter permease [Variovorax sp. J22P240]MDM0002747.1 amino acid ABC transporter permease [Variovorax sp. J22P240]
MSNWQRLVWNQRDAFAAGFQVTLEVCAVSFVFALIGGLVLALLRLYVKPLRPVAIGLIEFFRATPVLVQLLWVNYVWPELIGWPNSFFAAACVALALQSSGYLAETFRGAIESMPRGQVEAASSLGMSRIRAFWRIVLPQVLLDAAPSIGNQFTVIVKSSALVSVIAVPDLMFQSQKLTAGTNRSRSSRPRRRYTSSSSSRSRRCSRPWRTHFGGATASARPDQPT